MRIGASLVLIALGAILKFAVTARTSGINIGVVGVVLMVVGVIGLLITVAVTFSRRRTEVIQRPGHTTYIEPEDRADPRL